MIDRVQCFYSKFFIQNVKNIDVNLVRFKIEIFDESGSCSKFCAEHFSTALTFKDVTDIIIESYLDAFTILDTKQDSKNKFKVKRLFLGFFV